jgi:hypothetical protein
MRGTYTAGNHLKKVRYFSSRKVEYWFPKQKTSANVLKFPHKMKQSDHIFSSLVYINVL